MGWFFNRSQKSENSIFTVPTNENTSISPLEFEVLVNFIAKKIKRVTIKRINNGKVYCTVGSNSGVTSWDFSVDFLTNGDITPSYYIISGNADSNIPASFADSISELIRKSLVSGDSIISSKQVMSYCPYCGHSTNMNELYCNNCGRKTLKLEEKLISLRIEQEKTKQRQLSKDEEVIIRNAEISRNNKKRAEIELEENNRKRSFWLSSIKIIAPFITVLILIVLLFSGVNSYIVKSKHMSNGDIQIKFSSSDFENNDSNKHDPIKYKSVENDFKNAGFISITLDKQDDLGLLQGKKVGNVISVTINGTSDFEKGEWFSKDSKVKITYHVKK